MQLQPGQRITASFLATSAEVGLLSFLKTTQNFLGSISINSGD